MMKKSGIAGLGCLGIGIIGLLVFAGILVMYGISFNNSTVTLEENAKTEWSKVESAYQRRNDLIGNLVKTVQGAADFEKSTLTAVIEARAKATQTTIDPANITPQQMEAFQQAQSGLGGALSRLLVAVERYPDLKANQNFLDLQNQLEGTENRINVARDRYNEAVNTYNIKIKKFPGSFLAGILGFNEMTRFKSDPGAENAPNVEFDFK
jgi:LemA protein